MIARPIRIAPIPSSSPRAASGRAGVPFHLDLVAHPAPLPRVTGAFWLVMLAASSCFAAWPARAEDEAHRLDRLETQRLNRAALAARAAGPPPAPTLREREEAAIARWRAESDRCRAADRHDPCRHAATDLPKGAISDR